MKISRSMRAICKSEPRIDGIVPTACDWWRARDKPEENRDYSYGPGDKSIWGVIATSGLEDGTPSRRSRALDEHPQLTSINTRKFPPRNHHAENERGASLFISDMSSSIAQVSFPSTGQIDSSWLVLCAVLKRSPSMRFIRLSSGYCRWDAIAGISIFRSRTPDKLLAVPVP